MQAYSKEERRIISHSLGSNQHDFGDRSDHNGESLALGY